MEFICKRCNIKFATKAVLKTHLLRKNKCKFIDNDIDVQILLDELNITSKKKKNLENPVELENEVTEEIENKDSEELENKIIDEEESKLSLKDLENKKITPAEFERRLFLEIDKVGLTKLERARVIELDNKITKFLSGFIEKDTKKYFELRLIILALIL